VRGIVEQINISPGGVPKLPVAEAFVSTQGIRGDSWAHPHVHGGPLQALLLISTGDLDQLIADGFPVFPGALGENLTISGIDFRALRARQRWRVGPVVLELTKLRVPCRTLDRYNTNGQRIQEQLYDAQAKAGDSTTPRWARGGFYASVLREGIIRAKDIIELSDYAV